MDFLWTAITTAVAAVIFGVLVTRPSMRILTNICPTFFDQVDMTLMLGLEDGLYDYSYTPGVTEYYERRVENEALVFCIKLSAGFALLFSWAAGLLCGASTFAAVVLGLLGSFVPLFFGLALICLGSILLNRRKALPIPAEAVADLPTGKPNHKEEPVVPSASHERFPGISGAPGIGKSEAILPAVANPQLPGEHPELPHTAISDLALAYVFERQAKQEEADREAARLTDFMDRVYDEVSWQFSLHVFYPLYEFFLFAQEKWKLKLKGNNT